MTYGTTSVRTIAPVVQEQFSYYKQCSDGAVTGIDDFSTTQLHLVTGTYVLALILTEHVLMPDVFRINQ